MPSLQRIDGTTGTISETEIAATPPYPTAAIAKAAMVIWIDELLNQIMAQYPQAVRTLWPEEEALARKYDDGDASPSEMLLLERDATAKDRTIADHVARIIANADKFRGIGLEVRSLFLKTEHQLEAATSPDDFQFIIDTARAEAEAAAQEFGLIVSSDAA